MTGLSLGLGLGIGAGGGPAFAQGAIAASNFVTSQHRVGNETGSNISTLTGVTGSLAAQTLQVAFPSVLTNVDTTIAFIKFKVPVANSGVARRVMILNDGGNNNRIDLIVTSAGTVQLFIGSGEEPQLYNTNVFTLADNTYVTIVIRYNGTAFSVGRINGSSITWSTLNSAGTFPVGMNQVDIGHYLTGSQPLNGTIDAYGIEQAVYANDAAIVARVQELGG